MKHLPIIIIKKMSVYLFHKTKEMCNLLYERHFYDIINKYIKFLNTKFMKL
jgi:hypothetical protein